MVEEIRSVGEVMHAMVQQASASLIRIAEQAAGRLRASSMPKVL